MFVRRAHKKLMRDCKKDGGIIEVGQPPDHTFGYAHPKWPTLGCDHCVMVLDNSCCIFNAICVIGHRNNIWLNWTRKQWWSWGGRHYQHLLAQNRTTTKIRKEKESEKERGGVYRAIEIWVPVETQELNLYCIIANRINLYLSIYPKNIYKRSFINISHR